MAQAVEHNIERPFGGNARVELLERTGGGVARIGEGFLSRSLALSIQLQKGSFGQVNFAACFQEGRTAVALICVTVKTRGDAANRFEIRGNIITGGAVTSSCTAGKNSFLVSQINCQAIDFWFDDPIERFV